MRARVFRCSPVARLGLTTAKRIVTFMSSMAWKSTPAGTTRSAATWVSSMRERTVGDGHAFADARSTASPSRSRSTRSTWRPLEARASAVNSGSQTGHRGLALSKVGPPEPGGEVTRLEADAIRCEELCESHRRGARTNETDGRRNESEVAAATRKTRVLGSRSPERAWPTFAPSRESRLCLARPVDAREHVARSLVTSRPFTPRPTRPSKDAARRGPPPCAAR